MRSLDIQTYIWHGDLTGKLLALRALEAADRGVQVRILVDDMDARAKNAGFAALDAHERIEVRVFNPFASRYGTLSASASWATALSASTTACTTRAGSPTTASRWSADATWATSTSTPPRA